MLSGVSASRRPTLPVIVDAKGEYHLPETEGQ